MAITRAQQAKQMLQDGGMLVKPGFGGTRQGYRGPGEYRSGKSDPKKSGSTKNQVDTGDFGSEEANVKQNIAATLGGSGRSDPIESVNKLRRLLNTRPTVKKLPPIGPFGIATNLFNKQFQRFSDFTTGKNRDFFQKVIGAGRLNLGGKKINLETVGQMTEDELEDAYQDYMAARMSGEIDAYGNRIERGDRDNPIIFPQGIMTQAPSITEQEPEEDEGLRLAFRADGGRIGLENGGISLQEAKDMAPKGEFLAYINAKEAKMLKDAGGSGIMTNAGIPSFVEYGGQSGFESAKSTGSVQGDVDRGRGDRPTKKPTGGSKGPDTPLRFKKDIPDSFAKKFSVGDLINFGLIPDDEQENMKVAEAIDFSKLGVAKDKFTPDFGGMLDATKNLKSGYTGTTKEDFVNALESGAFQAGTSQMFDRNVKDLFEGVDLDKGGFGIGDVTPTFKGEEGFGGTIDIDKGALSKDALEKLPAGFFRVGVAEGGMPYEGGIMDLESARQMYGLGKLVKKVTRTVKKIAKSPIGKAALLYAGTAGLGALGAGATKAGSGSLFGFLKPGNVLTNLMTSGRNLGLLKSQFPYGKERVGPLSKLGDFLGSPMGIISATSALAGLLTSKQEEEAQELSRGEGIDIEAARRMILQAGTSGDQRGLAFRAEGGRIGYQEGSKEPVAKKTMPLLDMGGKEMDLREDGGFVPIGRMEKADDVPARLSKNEFVFTADAVRNAGDGDVDKGAEVMYNMMKNLEAGGDVSEESQGLEGARKMFQTSQRLEEVL